MGNIFSGGNVSGVESALEGLVPQFSGYASQAAALEPNFLGLESFFPQQAQTFETQGQSDIYPTSLQQFQAGASGNITPAQQAAVAQTKANMDTATRGTYGNLGLGGSTMQTQDLGGNDLSSLAQTEEFAGMDETLGLSGLQQALGYENAGVNTQTGALGPLTGALSTLTGAGNILSGASGALGSAGTLAAGQEALQMQALGGLGSALGSKL